MPEPVENVPEPVSTSASKGSGDQTPVKRKPAGWVRTLLWLLFAASIFVVSTGLKIKNRRLFSATFAVKDSEVQEWTARVKADHYTNFVTRRIDQETGSKVYDIIPEKKIDEHIASAESLMVQQYFPSDEFLSSLQEASKSSEPDAVSIYNEGAAKLKQQRVKGRVTVGAGLALFVVSIVGLVKT